MIFESLCKPKRIERKNTRLKHQSEQFVRENTYKGGRGAKGTAAWGLEFFLSIHFALQGRSRKLHFGNLGLTKNYFVFVSMGFKHFY